MKNSEKKKIKKFANYYGWSDVHPYEVVNVISEQTVEVRAMKATQTVFPKEFHVGGFSAHCSDQYRQDYKYESVPDSPTVRIRWSNAKNQWQRAGGMKFLMEDAPHKFYDYNY